jgi:DNA-binding response OmpR family regulator
MFNIAIVEDEPFTAAFLEKCIKELGHSVAFCSLCENETLEKLQENDTDLIFLDINLKGSLEGLWLAAEINKKFRIPFIYITAYKDRATVAKISKTKPFYFLSKPFDGTDIEIALSIFSEKISNVAMVELCDEYMFDMRTMSLYRDDTYIKLTQKERELLYLLIQNRGLVVSTDVIINSIWKDRAVGDSAIRDTIYRLRKKIEGLKVKNISSLGYIFPKDC